MTILDKVRLTIKEYGLIKDGEMVLVAVSGGPDSLAMLEILFRLKDEFNYRLHVVHLNHRLREEASKEAEFVRSFARSRDISVTIFEYDIPDLLEKEGGSVQYQAREVRYRLFNELASQIGADKISLGHHADDLSETVMMRFLRGSGLEGLIGFTAQSRKKLIRPLIRLTREEVENFCQKEGLTPCYDPSNAKSVYFRNSVRLKLIPELESVYNPNLRHQLVQMSYILDEENQLLEDYAMQVFKEILIKFEEEVLYFDIQALSKKKPAMVRRILRIGIEKLKGDKKNLYYQHYHQMQDLIFHGEVGKMIYLPDEYLLYRGYKELCLGKRDKILRISEKQSLGNYILDIPGKIYLRELDLWIKSEVVTNRVLAKGNQIALDADMIGQKLLIRSRRPGDLFYPLGLQGKKKVKKFMIDEKVDRLKRDLIPIVTTIDEKIIWIANYRMDERFKVTERTKRTCILTTFSGEVFEDYAK